MRIRVILLHALVVASVAGTGCTQPKLGTFTPGDYEPDATEFREVSPTGATKILETLHATVWLEESQFQQILFGEATLSLSNHGDLMVNLSAPATSERTGCSFWFRVPLTPRQWQVGASADFMVQLLPGQYVADQYCASRYDGTSPLLLGFTTREEGERFLNLVAALAEAPLAPTESEPMQTLEEDQATVEPPLAGPKRSAR